MIIYKYHITVSAKVNPKSWAKKYYYETIVTNNNKLSKNELQTFAEHTMKQVRVNGFIMKTIPSTIKIESVKSSRDYL